MVTIKDALLLACTAFVLSGCVTATRAVLDPADRTANAGPPPPCPAAGSLGPEYDAPINRGSFNQELFDAAVRHYTNVKRCENGVTPLSGDRGLVVAASGHSADMARLGFLEHDSPVPGKETFTDRMDQAGVSYRSAAENLARNSRLQINSGEAFQVVDRASCQFNSGGQPITAHSYRSLAAEMVDDWVRSPGHRENLMSAKYRRVGSGGAHAANPRNCGDVYATQNFAA